MPIKKTSIKKVLIANRGEIACRVIDTCRRLGIATVAVYSDADAQALHVERADEARHIGPPAPRESYLDVKKIIRAAKETGADAIHPGYGFLSENEDFAAACDKAGIVFIGPPAAAIMAMGGKSEAKALMEKAGVPLVPGYHGDKQDEKFLAAEAVKIGFPVLIKASAGGGGKGMRVVEKPEDFSDQLSGAKREAKAAFGDDHVLIEKYLTRPRHVEIQVFADRAGNTVYLFERDCSVQRRHQKVLEEAPAPGLKEETRQKMGEAAVAAAKAIGYVGAGTVEFLLDEDQSFYFMEMNTRLQVEHPVTEMITGLDLVELQIRVAEGYELPFAQQDLKIDGHAFEARLYAEDPANNFLPSPGKISFLEFPDGARIDTGVRESFWGQDEVSIHYDPMIAKVIVHGPTRDDALRALSGALDGLLIAGLKTNLGFLRRLATNEAFAKGDLSTRFISQHEADLLPPSATPDATALTLAALGLWQSRLTGAGNDPWQDRGGWRIGGPSDDVFVFQHGEARHEVKAMPRGDMSFDVSVDGAAAVACRLTTPGRPQPEVDFTADIGGAPHRAILLRQGRHVTLLAKGREALFTYLDPLSFEAAEEETGGRLTAPMPGKVVALRVKEGDAVKKGQPLIIVEAMKMEHTILAPSDGTVEAVNANVGDQVDEKLELVRLRA